MEKEVCWIIFRTLQETILYTVPVLSKEFDKRGDCGDGGGGGGDGGDDENADDDVIVVGVVIGFIGGDVEGVADVGDGDDIIDDIGDDDADDDDDDGGMDDWGEEENFDDGEVSVLSKEFDKWGDCGGGWWW